MHVLAWLREQGALTPAQHEAVVHQAQRSGERVEEAILSVGALEEAELLKRLAAHYQTRFVSTERLAKATIDRKTLQRLPLDLAERLSVFPVVFDARSQTLSVVAAAPGEDDLEKQIQVVTGLRAVRAYVARPAAIAAAIEKFYRGNPSAFAALGSGGHRLDEIGAPDVFEGMARGGPSAPMGESDLSDPFAGLAAAPPRPAPVETSAAAPLVPLGTIPADLPGEPQVTLEAYLETLNVFVSLMEREREELRGHSGRVAKLCGEVAGRVGLSATDRHALLVAAHLHDVGKTSDHYHLTPLNVARYEGHRQKAQKTRLSPARLFEGASLPAETVKILAHLYERFDGQGFPDRLAGKDIPYGARVLALVETYADLITNERNPYRRVLSVPQALSVIKDLGGQLFDPNLADVLVHLVVGEEADQSLGARTRALVVDADPEETTVLEMRMLEHGFAVTVARTLPDALEAIAGELDVVVTEVDLGGGTDGFDLAARIAETPEEKRPAVIFLTARSDRESVTRGFDLGAADYLVKPASAEVVATKAAQAVEAAARQRAGGVSGSLKEMSLPNLVQILANGRRGGRLQITAGAKRGEIHFADGQIHDAAFDGARGEDAFYAMLRLEEGSFHLDPSAGPGERRIHASTEGLLLEGMRRIDEGLI